MKTHSANQQLWVLVLLTMLSTIGLALPYPIFAPLVLHPDQTSLIPLTWGDNSRALLFGTLLAVYPLGLFLGSPVLGGLSDQYGRKRLICGSLLLAFVGYLITAFAIHIGSISLLLFSRFFTGFAESNIAIFRSAVADLKTIDKHRGFGLINGGATMGYVVGPLLGGVLSNSHIVPWFNFSTPFYFSALIVLLGMAIAYQILPQEDGSSRVNRQSLTLKQRFQLWQQLKQLCKNPILKVMFAFGFCYFFAVDTFYEFYPALLATQLNLAPLEIAIMTATLSLGIAVGNVFLSGFFASRFAILPTVVWHMLGFAISLLLMIVITNIYYLALIFAIAGILIGVASNLIYVHISNQAQDAQQGQTLGMASSLRMLGDASISFIGGILLIVSIHLPLLVAVGMVAIAVTIIVGNCKKTFSNNKMLL